MPVRNEERDIGEQLEALVRQEWNGDWRVLVVDNGSSDGTIAVLDEYVARSPRLSYIIADERSDKSFAANCGVRAAAAEAVVFCDGDDVVADGWLTAMAEGLT